MMWAMRRAGVRLPEAMTSTFMTFVATVAFFALAGPLAIYLGAGKSLAEHNVVLGITYYDLFRTSLTIFGVLGVLMLVAMVFPVWLRDAVHWLATRLERRNARVAARIDHLREGIDRAHECLVAFGSPKGWLALFWAVLLSGPSHANKLLAGYVALRALGLHANFVDILLVQTLVMFLLYFAPTPGASGIGEVLSAAAMSSYVPRELTPIYILIWRLILTYFTLDFGFEYGGTLLTSYIGQRVMYDLRLQLFGHLQRLSISYFDRHPVGRLMTRVTSDVETLNELFSSGVVTIFGDAFTLVAIMGMMLAIDLRLALVTFAVIPLVWLTARIFRRRVREAFGDIRVRLARLNAFLQERLSGMRVVQLFGREEASARRFAALNREHLEAHLRSITIYAVFFPAVEVLTAVAMALLLWYGGLRVL